MIEALVAFGVILVAFFAGRFRARSEQKESYRDTKKQIDEVRRADDGDDVAERLRKYSRER